MQFRKNSIIFTKDAGFIGNAICAAQNLYWKEVGKKSQFSHVVFIGPDGKCRESVVKMKWVKVQKKIFGIKISIPQLKFVNGIYISDPETRYKDAQKEYSKMAVEYGFKWSKSVWEKAAAYGDKLYAEKQKYGGIELFGTLWVITKWKWYMKTKQYKKADELLLKENPFNSSKMVYCIAFVADAVAAGGVKNYLNVDDDPQPDVNSSTSTVDHGWWTKVPCKREMLFNRD